MKCKTLLSFVVLTLGIHPIYAAILSESEAGESAPEIIQSPAPTTSNAASIKAPLGGLPNLPKDLSQITPQQSAEILRQAQQLKPEQLQAIAKSVPQNPQAQAEARAQAEADAGLIEMIADAVPPPPVERPKSVKELQREEAFNALLEDVLPLSPDQITNLHKFYDMTLQARAAPPNPPPKPDLRSQVVPLEPGSQPPVIRLATGFVTSVLFIDSSGEKWPLTAYSIGDPESFNIQWDQKGNALFIQSKKQYSHGNLAVRLWGLDTPVMITLVSGQKNVDFRVDLQVSGRGPDAKIPIVETAITAKVNPLLINLLDGVPPRGSVKLGVSGGHGDAWLADSRVYFRTKLTVLSPAWTATVASPDGTHVYELMLTPYILASQNGKTIDIKLSGL